MSNIYIGIDIGKHGAIAVMNSNGTIDTYAMPLIKKELDYHALNQLISTLSSTGSKVHVVFEKLGVIFGSAKSVAFSMGEQIGAIEMCCIAHNISYTKSRAIDWQKEMFTGVQEVTKPSTTGKKEVRDTKAMALLAIKRIFPELKLTFGKIAFKPHDGLIDAVLMAEYARRRNL